MDILRLSAIALICAVLAVFLKQHKNEYAIFVSITGGVIVLFSAIPYMREIYLSVADFANRAGLGTLYMGAILKVIFITFVTECAAALCRDVGESALASGLEIAGKLIILALSMPIVSSLFDTILSVLPF